MGQADIQDFEARNPMFCPFVSPMAMLTAASVSAFCVSLQLRKEAASQSNYFTHAFVPLILLVMVRHGREEGGQRIREI
jgi:hypothetical protein